jgi:hypothetical protein
MNIRMNIRLVCRLWLCYVWPWDWPTLTHRHAHSQPDELRALELPTKRARSQSG